MRTAWVCLLAPFAFAQSWVMEPVDTDASLRGISVVDSSVAWASGSGGTVLKTKNGGKSWMRIDVPESAGRDFRGVLAFDATRVALMSSGTGADSAIFRNAGESGPWNIWYSNHDASGFFDAVVPAGPGKAFVLGDPVDGRFVFAQAGQADGGSAWVSMPKALPGEGAFAASNSSLVLRGARVWFATGGASGARVFRSVDGGRNWSVVNTPVRADAEGAGIFSLAFRNDEVGIAVGGSYKNPKEDLHNVAFTADGGATWTEPSGKRPRGYRSAVAWLPEQKMWITTGPTGSELSRDDGRNWIPFADEAFHALGVGRGAEGEDVCFAVGPNGRIGRLLSSGTR